MLIIKQIYEKKYKIQSIYKKHLQINHIYRKYLVFDQRLKGTINPAFVQIY